VRKISAERLIEEYRAEVHRLIAEIDIATERNCQLAENSVKKIRQLIEDTDGHIEERNKTVRQILEDTNKRISVYMREQERSRRGEELYTSLGKGIRAALETKEQGTGNREKVKVNSEQVTISNEQLTMNNEQGTGKSEKRTGNREQGTGDSELSAAKKPSSASQSPSSKSPPSKDRKLNMQIAEMSAQGLDSTEIASRLNMSLTEVDLALTLLHRPNGG